MAFVDKSVRVLVLHNWNQLPETLKAKYFFATFKHLKGQQRIGLEPSASVKLAVIWIINNRLLLGSRSISGLIRIILGFFVVNFVHLELFFFTLYFFIFFIGSLINKNIHTNIIDISNFRNGLNHPCCSSVFYFENKLWKALIKCKNNVF